MARKSIDSLKLELSSLKQRLEHAESLMDKVLRGEPVKLRVACTVTDLDKDILKLRKQVTDLEVRISVRKGKEDARQR